MCASLNVIADSETDHMFSSTSFSVPVALPTRQQVLPQAALVIQSLDAAWLQPPGRAPFQVADFVLTDDQRADTKACGVSISIIGISQVDLVNSFWAGHVGFTLRAARQIFDRNKSLPCRAKCAAVLSYLQRIADTTDPFQDRVPLP